MPQEKMKLHPRNRHRGRYDFAALIASCRELAPFVAQNSFGDDSIDFADPDAVKMLNLAILKKFYDIEFWEIPNNYLCPPIPGRADYIHYAADLLAAQGTGQVPAGIDVKCLDIGTGANCVYPIIGRKEYDWSFVCSDSDPVSIKSAKEIIEKNAGLKGNVECRLQRDPKSIFRGIIGDNERFDLSICNPPFHASIAEAASANLRKLSNLNNRRITKPTKNFGGQNREIWCEGGEEMFARKMIRESSDFRNSCLWFSILISKRSSLRGIYNALKQTDAFVIKTIPMGQGNKISRVVAWTFMNEEMQFSRENGRLIENL